MSESKILRELPEGLLFSRGGGPSIDTACVMQAVSWVSGERWTDHPKCACPVISAFMRRVNDALPEPPRTKLLKRFVVPMVGSKSTLIVERKRAFIAADYAVRVFAPIRLRARGNATLATKLQSLAPIVNKKTARTAADAAADAADAAADAADAAADAADAAADAADAAAYAATAAAYAAAAAAAVQAKIIECIQAMLNVTE